MEEGTYMQRVNRIFHMMDMSTLFTTDRQIDTALKTLHDHAAGVTIGEVELRRSVKIKESCTHPDTGQKIFLPLRLSAIIPANMCADFLMISARGTLQNVGAQWANQTYNACHYWANRNASNSQDYKTLMMSYTGATASSVAAAVGMSSLVDKGVLPMWMRRLVPVSAVAAADILNLSVMRKDEYLQGVQIYDLDGNEIGKSKIAGGFAVAQCVFGRVAAATPVLTIPPLIADALQKRSSLLQRRPGLYHPLLLGLVGIFIQFSVPFSFGTFKQKADINVSHLEPHLQGLKGKDGTPIETVVYNKGI